MTSGSPEVTDSDSSPAQRSTLVYYEQSLAEYRGLGDERGAGVVLQRLAVHVAELGDLEHARALAEESLSLHETMGYKKGEAVSVGTLARFARREGDVGLAADMYERSISLAEESGFVWWHAAMLLELGELLLERGQRVDSEDRIRRALPLC